MEASRTLTAVPSSSQRTQPTGDVREHIRRRAYELYEQRGRSDGHDMDDWLQAEGELSQQKRDKMAA